MSKGSDVTPLRLGGFDDCIVGVGSRCGQAMVIYDAEKILDKLSQEMSREEALDHYYSKIEGDWQGEGTPVFMQLATYEDIVERSGKFDGISN